MPKLLHKDTGINIEYGDLHITGIWDIVHFRLEELTSARNKKTEKLS